MKIEELKQGQAVWVKGFVDRSVFGGCGGFINFYNQDGNHCGHISRINVREMKEEDVQIDQPKLEVPKCVFEMIKKRKEFNQSILCTLVNLDVFDEASKQVRKNDELFIKAWIAYPNITVEKEKLYTVEIPNPNKEGFEKLVLGKCYNNKIAICLTPNENWEKLGAYKLTEQEIRKDFDWSWQWAKEVTEL